MIALLASTLFAAAGCMTLAAMALSWLRYGRMFRSLRQELAGCETTRELRYVVVTTQVLAVRAAAWSPGFRPLAQAPQRHCLPRRPALRAAA